MNMKFKFLAAITMAMGLYSCSNDEGLDNTTSGGQGILGNAETYATIRIAMPGGADAMGRALTKTDPEDGDGTEEGIGMENEFQTISLYFFDGHNANSTCKGVLTLNRSDFGEATNSNNDVIYSTSAAQKIGIEGSNMNVYAVMNGSGVPGTNAGASLKTFLANQVKKADAINQNWLLMTSRTPGIVSLSSTKNNTPEKAAELSVCVERTAAKISYMAKNAENKYSVQNDKTSNEVATVTLNSYKLVNLRNDAYYFRKVADEKGNWEEAENFGNGPQTYTNYVIDPFFTEKTVDIVNNLDFHSNWFGEGKPYAEYSTTSYINLPTSTSTYEMLSYCMENTTIKAAQLNAYSTGIIFKATYAPKQVYVLKQDESGFDVEKYTSGDTFYSYANVLYKNKAEIVQYYNIDENSPLIQTFEGDSKTGATCYYKYWIRHMNNDNNEDMGIMEFAIVRNNVYKLTVESVSKLGDPTDNIDPENPDETSKMYLEVNITILPWVVRNNNIEL